VVAGRYRVGGSDGAPYENPVKGEKTNSSVDNSATFDCQMGHFVITNKYGLF
jgi:hypothetical protein